MLMGRHEASKLSFRREIRRLVRVQRIDAQESTQSYLNRLQKAIAIKVQESQRRKDLVVRETEGFQRDQAFFAAERPVLVEVMQLHQ